MSNLRKPLSKQLLSPSRWIIQMILLNWKVFERDICGRPSVRRVYVQDKRITPHEQPASGEHWQNSFCHWGWVKLCQRAWTTSNNNTYKWRRKTAARRRLCAHLDRWPLCVRHQDWKGLTGEKHRCQLSVSSNHVILVARLSVQTKFQEDEPSFWSTLYSLGFA